MVRVGGEMAPGEEQLRALVPNVLLSQGLGAHQLIDGLHLGRGLVIMVHVKVKVKVPFKEF